ncbi:hypothetical protein LL037_07865 [Clostridium estertheticum]|uniref:Uncharacterized protein n=1 Tax=Clostridium estertheticum TaxID=238834 RepID=A0AA47EHT0_9CLOT|nr:hypothetical protein [Clostridium estertheticum]MBU3156451.1 hypothetical protein [Clostridium estertheticum]MBU3199863.1 hypothetical protein [Clostridium estertheticum]WAG58908.1 hypothetical protein LL038_14780 [Clostridium estertheticum]WAG67037.1 hypothetical protein LL037_07865 [Clostridium estertheticum]
MGFDLIITYLAIIIMVPYSIIYAFDKGTSGIKVLLLGINLTLAGGIFAIIPDFDVNGVWYLLVLFGLIISFKGISKTD